jgi:putative RNA 2'-phosphotransferase
VVRGEIVSQASKFLALLLRHQPERIGIQLDEAGWTDIDALLDALHAHDVDLSRAELDQLVASSDKQRFAISEDGRRIRANQGHSVQVELALPAATPPQMLYHGTIEANLAGIREKGLLKGQRHHVHLSADIETATKVGGRRGKPVVLAVRAGEMVVAGHTFFQSANGVWLVDHVPPGFIELDDTVVHTDLVPRGGGSVSRAHKIEIAKQSLAACKDGFYTTSSGGRVEIAGVLEAARAGTTLYERGRDTFDPPVRGAPTQITVTSETTIEALVRLAPDGGHIGCLNFASAKRPGGGFLGGAQAQEESLARASGLYPCLNGHPDYYARNRAFGSALYLDLVLYSPRVPFFRDDNGGWLPSAVLASVITAAAPNVSALKEANAFDEEDVAEVLQHRSELVFAVAAHHKIERLVLGAWGAGVFGNDPGQVARIFRDLLAGPYAGAFAHVVFAVLGTRETSTNHRVFAEVFG